MRSHPRNWVVLCTGLALVVGSLVLGPRSSAAPEKALGDAIDKIAEAVKKGDMDGAKKLAADCSKKVDHDVLMKLYKLRSQKGGIGVGAKEGAISPDGIEKKLMKLAEAAPSAKDLAVEADALVELGHRMAAISLVSAVMEPEDQYAKKKLKKRMKDWATWNDEMVKASQEFSAAAKAKKADDLHKAAVKADKACGKCHDAIRFD